MTDTTTTTTNVPIEIETLRAVLKAVETLEAQIEWLARDAAGIAAVLDSADRRLVGIRTILAAHLDEEDS